ncbi:MAG TPA: peptidylprolyl isomerase [Acidimicrobiales bacterium]|nr:peptidylprolyl isomerase [Acidimicrobiales bacterium]
MKKLTRLFAAAVATTLAVSGVAACKSAAPYAAKVNGIVLSKAGLDAELDAIRGNKQYLKALKDANVPVDGPGDNAKTFGSQFVARILTRRIFLELVHQEVVRRKLKVAKKDLKVARDQLVASVGDENLLDDFPKPYYNEIRRTTAEVYVLQNALADTSDKNLRKYYDEHTEQFETVCAAHILVAAKPDADKIVKDLAKAKDKAAAFAELAKTKSTDTGSGANGGDLGCNPPSTYVAEFKDAVRTQKIGVIGQPVKTQFGFHVIRVDSREAAKPFAEVEEQVRSAITDSQQGPFTEFIVNASTKAKVEVNPRYGSFDKSGQQPEVVPPKSPSAGSGN